MKHLIEIRHDWCKACGICIALCPKSVLEANKTGKPEAAHAEHCIGCFLCEYRCPDFAIRIRREL